ALMRLSLFSTPSRFASLGVIQILPQGVIACELCGEILAKPGGVNDNKPQENSKICYKTCFIICLVL
ncbi:hypothetical protein, partial [Bacteroides sp. 519]|uniref:hypothetical protein n=1 Tax=Bacteroides sp. 519 TaxID=2302937 RepID=UPI00194023BC